MKKVFALLLCGFIMLSLVNPVNASNIAVTSKRTIVSEGVYNNGTESQVGNIPSLDEEVKELNETIKSGEVTGKKSGYFENKKDKEDKTVKINIDLTAKCAETGKDTIFILDESGSMGSYLKENSGLYLNDATPCQNHEHYYKIEKGTYGAKDDIYIKLDDYIDSDIFPGWIKTINQINKSLNLNIPTTEIAARYLIKNHYYKENGVYKQIPLSQYYDSLGSPEVDNPYGCIDKGTVAHAGIWDITKSLIESSSKNRVAFVGFSFNLRDNVDFSNDLDMLEPIIKNTELELGTDYGVAFSAAKALIEKRENTDIPLNVIFISDGVPTYNFTVDNDNYKYIKNLPNTKIYTINIMASESTLLKEMAYPSDLYNYCANLDELNNVFTSLEKSLIEYPKAEVTDVVGEDFTLRVDENHPITIDGVEYKNIEDIPKEIATISEDERTLTFTPQTVTEKGYRISFYETLNNEVLEKDELSGAYDTNEKCEIKYKKLNVKGEAIVEDSEYTTIALPTPEYKIVTKIEDDDNNGDNNGGNNDNTPNDIENNKNDEIKGAVNTSDENNIYLYITLLGVSILGMGYVLRKKFVK